MEERSEEDKMVELQDVLIGCWILMDRSLYDWGSYRARNGDEWAEMKGMVILLSEVVVECMVVKSEQLVWKIFSSFIFPFSISSSAVQCSLVRLCTSASDRVGRDFWNGHRVVCWMVGWIMDERNVTWTEDTIDCLVEYLVKLLECDDMEIVKWAILAGEKWWVKMQTKMSSERRDRLRTALIRHSTNADTVMGELELDLDHSQRYQVGWCARWCEDNLMATGLEQIPPIKLSRDRFEVRCDTDETHITYTFRSTFFPPVCSAFSVNSNVHFYEVTLLTNGLMQFGWNRKETRFGMFGINCNHSIMLQVGEQCLIRHKGQSYPIHRTPPLRPVNVIGCLLDLVNRRVMFYLNGQALNCRDLGPRLPSFFQCPKPCFATARLIHHQQCHFNFGQSPFAYPPENIQFTTFDEQSGGDALRYRLVESEWCSDSSWFKHTPLDNQVSLFFSDEMQSEFEGEVTRVEEDIENDREIGEWRLVGDDCEDNKKWRGVRYIQAIIEVMGNGDKVDVKAQLVGRLIENTVERVHKEKLLELLYPYLQLIPIQSTLNQHRSICIVLLHLIKCDLHHGYYIIHYIRPSVFTYLIRMLTYTRDEWTQLLVLIALTDLEMSEEEKREIEVCENISQMMAIWRHQFEGKNVVQLLNSEPKHIMHYQLYLCSINLLNSLNPNADNTEALPDNQGTLNSHDHSPHLILSPCGLSARSDWHWQSVRSVCQVSANIYYFEVVLLTSGPMTIGWATKRTDLARTEVGGDEYSMGFDGFNRAVRHEDSQLNIETISRWKSGDVVGCLLDHSNRKFAFTLNGHQLPLSTNIYFSSQPYHACVSLSTHQQVYFNFGQTSFKHPPKRVDYLEFHQIIPSTSAQSNSSSSFHFTNAQLRNVFIANQSINQMENFTQSSITTSNVASNSTLPTECQLCHETAESTLLRFVCCDTLSFCRDCVNRINDCPKCTKKFK